MGSRSGHAAVVVPDIVVDAGPLLAGRKASRCSLSIRLMEVSRSSFAVKTRLSKPKDATRLDLDALLLNLCQVEHGQA